MLPGNWGVVSLVSTLLGRAARVACLNALSHWQARCMYVGMRTVRLQLMRSPIRSRKGFQYILYTSTSQINGYGGYGFGIGYHGPPTGKGQIN